MALPKIDPTNTAAWHALKDHFNDIRDELMSDWFDSDPNRAKRFSLKWEDFYVDYSKNRIKADTMQLLLNLAADCGLKEAMEDYFSGEIINETEGRAVLHTALRANPNSEVIVNGTNVIPEVTAIKEKMRFFCDEVVSGSRTGYSGKPFTDIVNVGIGGSDLGPAMVVDALTYYGNHLKTHFVSNVDGDHVHEIIKTLNPETTLFIIVSKSFTTQETLSNANTIREWFLRTSEEWAIENHFVAVSTNIEKVRDFGISEDNIFPMWDWVGGRFSLWSAVGLSIALAVGYDNFNQLLEGARKMDEHFREADFSENIPVILALLSIWYNNFFEAESEAIIPYSQYLEQFATYLQQAVMESNGKGIDRSGEAVGHQTGSGGSGADIGATDTGIIRD